MQFKRNSARWIGFFSGQYDALVYKSTKEKEMSKVSTKSMQ